MLGNIFPDFFLFLKDFSAYKRNLETHTWKTVSRLFQAAETDSERAFAHGYAAHLSADIVAHNHFVPQHLMYMSKGRMASHLLLEYAEEGLHNNRYRSVMNTLMNDAEDKGALFLRVMNIEKSFFRREIHTLSAALTYQKVLRIQEAVKAYKMLMMPSFEEHCESFRVEAERLAGISVEDGYKKLEKHDPTGKKAMSEAREKHDRLVKNVGKKKLKTRYRKGDTQAYKPS
jgi:hypothetical protein